MLCRLLPSNRIMPAVTGCTPEIARSNVVLPAPLAPIRVAIWPAPTLIDTPCRTSMRPYPATRLSISSIDRLLCAMDAEIRLDNCRVRLHFDRAAFGEGPPICENMDPVGDVHDESHVVL